MKERGTFSDLGTSLKAKHVSNGETQFLSTHATHPGGCPLVQSIKQLSRAHCPSDPKRSLQVEEYFSASENAAAHASALLPARVPVVLESVAPVVLSDRHARAGPLSRQRDSG